MKFATLDNGTRDGELILVSRDLERWQKARSYPHLQAALDDWGQSQKVLQEQYDLLNDDPSQGTSWAALGGKLLSPLPRAYEWVDGSAYINHIELVRKARGAEPPATLYTDPLVYQGGSGTFLAPTQEIPLRDPEWGLDFESEICVVLNDTPMGTTKAKAGDSIMLLMLCNDVSLRNLIPEELKKGFGFFTSKPSSAFAPIAVTPDELGESFREGRCYLPMKTYLNGELFGDPESGEEMHFSFYDLIEHITKTRSFTAGTILGSGTVSNRDESRGSSCLAEKRMREKLNDGEVKTPFLQENDHIKIEMHDQNGRSIFGAIDQRVKRV